MASVRGPDSTKLWCRALEKAQVVVMVVDASDKQGITPRDLAIAQHVRGRPFAVASFSRFTIALSPLDQIVEEGRAVIFAVNKVDTLQGNYKVSSHLLGLLPSLSLILDQPKDYAEKIFGSMIGLLARPEVVVTSALEGDGLDTIMPAVYVYLVLLVIGI